MAVYFRRTPFLSCNLNFRHLLRRLMFDAWGELIEASIETKHIILYMKVVQTDFLSVKGEIKKKERKSRRRRRRKENSFLRNYSKQNHKKKLQKKNRRTLTSQRQSVDSFMYVICKNVHYSYRTRRNLRNLYLGGLICVSQSFILLTEYFF